VRDVPALVELLAADEDTAELAARRLVRVGPALVARAAPLVAGAPPRARARLARAVARVGGEGALAFLLARADDDDAKTRRAALVGLGKIGGPDAERALRAAWEQVKALPDSVETRATVRAIAEGFVNDAIAARADADPELARIVARTRRIAARDVARTEESAIDELAAPDRALLGGRGGLPLVFFCRAGLEEICAEELEPSWGARATRPGEVRATLHGPLASVFASRVATHVGLLLPKVDAGPDLAEAVAKALTSEAARAMLGAFTRGRARYRIAWEEGGHKRAVVWKIAERVAQRAPELVNDPRQAPWEARVRTQLFARAGAARQIAVEVALVPRGMRDPRFAYRVADVPAASHPTIAAALARVAGVREDDVVWDPFVGSGLELAERARLGPYRSLLGTDLDADALDAARANLAGIEVKLTRGDALLTRPRAVTLILTNPPMGRRVVRQGELRTFLEGFVAHAARVLEPGGRLVWISPRPRMTRLHAERAGLRLERGLAVDMGGFQGEIQRWQK
jgi:23S rRNA G2445 N2-methylase RlmL